MESSLARQPDRVGGMSSTEIAKAAGMSQPQVSAITNTVGVPGVGRRRGISVANGERIATAMRAGVLNERAARAVAEDPDLIREALTAMSELLEEIERSQREGSAA